ncbi:Innexin [Teladorsagia circumcincta]|uniref:Innexin n=1 Tax=Teladorsagia circumcincta TaxID=45464 RepID=A0A2G9UXW8_TELCI|nr:Innexin [Teladorsagia circumcincta]
MSFFARAYYSIGHLDPTYDVDSSDRLKYVYTPWILCGTAFLIFAHEYVGAPIQCWAPKQWAGGWEQYAEQYCLIENTYFVRMNDSNLPDAREREDREIRYYQWVPFVLLLQAFLLYLPRLVWKQLQFLTKIDLPSVTVALRNEAKRITDPLNVASIMRPARRGVWGYKLTLSLLFTKMLSIVVVVGQVLFVGWFLGAGFLHGLRVVVDALNGRRWEESGNFPRVTFCDLEVRELGGAVHRWSLQCVLMINMFNEKIFVFLWWWFCILLFISILNLFRWLIRLSFDAQRSFITAVLESAINDDFDAREVSEFCRKTLKTDGVTIVRLIEENATIYQMSAIAVPIVSDSDPLKPERSAAAADDTTDAQSTTSADSGNGSLNNSSMRECARTPPWPVENEINEEQQDPFARRQRRSVEFVIPNVRVLEIPSSHHVAALAVYSTFTEAA